ncbi:MAG: hypothetical protein AAGE52_11720 [Myxococcota bacterium]
MRILKRATYVLAVSMAMLTTAQAQEEIPPTEDAIPDDGFRPREDTYETSRGLAMGAGARASAMGTSAVAYNAANMALARMYHIETFGSYLPNEGAWALGGAVADSVSNKIAAGMSFRGVYGDGNRNYRGYDARLSLGMPLSDSIGIGVSGRYVRLRSRQRNEDGERVGTSLRAFTMDASVRLTAAEGLHIAALGYNLIQTDSPLAPTLLGGSVSYTIANTFTLGVDVFADITSFDDTEIVVGAGAEFLAGGQVPIRAGFRRDQGRELNQLTLGIGYVDQKVGVDIALRQDVASDTKESSLVMSFRYHVQ